MNMFFLLIVTLSVCSLSAANKPVNAPTTGSQGSRTGLGVKSKQSNQLCRVDSDDDLPPTAELAQRQAGNQRPQSGIKRNVAGQKSANYDADVEDNV